MKMDVLLLWFRTKSGQLFLALAGGTGVSLFSAYCLFDIREDVFWLGKSFEFFLLNVIFYPIIEELSFRGIIQTSLSGISPQYIFRGITFSNVITSILFSAIHAIHNVPFLAVLVFFPSLIFGYFRDEYGSVFPSIFLHSFYNLIFLSLVKMN
jgi:membrane protease YdiL (CAAX protease family)